MADTKTQDQELFHGDGNQTLAEYKSAMGCTDKRRSDQYANNGQFKPYWGAVQDPQKGWNR